MPDLQKIAREIDAHFDSMESEGMPLWQYRLVEDARDRAHARLMEQAVSDGYGKLGQS